MSAHTTCAPSEANRRAVASPMPLPAPVITAVRPTRRRHTSFCLRHCRDHSSVLMKTFLVSVKAAGASGPSSRPSPDCLNPPNGVQ